MFAYKMNIENNIAYSLIFVTYDTKRHILTVSIFTKIIHLFEMSSLYEKNKSRLFHLHPFHIKKNQRKLYLFISQVYLFLRYIQSVYN